MSNPGATAIAKSMVQCFEQLLHTPRDQVIILTRTQTTMTLALLVALKEILEQEDCQTRDANQRARDEADAFLQEFS